MDPSDVPSRFYRGLVAELYEPLLSSPARADDYAPFLARSGTPALELACGSGLPLVELVERDWRRRWWTQEQFREMLAAAGFEKLALLSPEGGRARPKASVFVALAQRSGP